MSNHQLGHARTVVYGFLMVAIGLAAGLAYLSPHLQLAAEAGWTTSEPAKVPEPGFLLTIPKLNLEAPIIPDVHGTDEAAYLKAIENGVAQMDGTSKPDAAGNMFVFGHSSYYATKPGNYKQVFKRLNELKTGDEFSVDYQSKQYTYSVTESKIVSDTDWSMLKPSADENEKMVTLMTCWPPGTLAKRYVVIAKQTAVK